VCGRIPEETLNWAFDLCVRSAEKMFDLIEKPKPSKDELTDELGKKILSYLGTCENGQDTIRNVARKFHAKTSDALKSIAMLEELGEVEKMSFGRKKGVKLT
jgi:hypothetical protein